MRITQAAQAPFIIEVPLTPGKLSRIAVPMFTFDDYILWSAIDVSEREQSLTSGMDGMTRFKLISLFPVAPVDIYELRDRRMSPGGMKHITMTCLSRAQIIAESSDDGQTFVPLNPPRPLDPPIKEGEEPDENPPSRQIYEMAKSSNMQLTTLTIALSGLDNDSTRQKSALKPATNTTLGTEGQTDESPLTPSANASEGSPATGSKSSPASTTTIRALKPANSRS